MTEDNIKGKKKKKIPQCPTDLKYNTKIVKRGLMILLILKYMSTHFPELTQALK